MLVAVPTMISVSMPWWRSTASRSDEPWIKALNRVDVFLLMDKGPAKQKLRALREALCRQHIKDRAYRFVEEMEHVRAGSIDYAARENVRFHGRNALVTAQQLVKMDGEQIHMG